MQTRLWQLRSKASKLLHAQAERLRRKPLRCIEDAVVPVEHSLTYVKTLQEILKEHDCEGAIFGHVGDGHFHVNPKVSIDKPDLEGRVYRLMDEVFSLVLKLGGSMSGEHGDGFLRARFMKQQWPKTFECFQTVKSTFDPRGILNPGKKIPALGTHPPRFKTYA